MNKFVSKKLQLRELVKMALVTSPIIGIYTITPMVLHVISLPEIEKTMISWSYLTLLKALSGISVFVFIQWMINIWLFHFLDDQLNRTVHQNWKYLFSYTVMFVIVFLFRLKRAEHAPIDFGSFGYYPIIAATANNTFILIIYWLITGKHEKAQLELAKTRLELAQYVTQQEQLKNKIHPHFIFNALNTLKLLIKKEQQTAEDYLVRLSAHLRFSITEAAKDQALIKNELEFCQNYIELQKVRFANSIQFENYLPNEVINNEYLPVVTLQSLAENAIKHNAFTKNNPLIIKIRQNEDNSITFSNNLIPKRNPEATTGTGLNNLKKRFKLLGNAEPTVLHNIKDKQFEVTFDTLKK
ncbi:sensor histidine kinase [Flammeovirga aprica]|uniref:Histidine kinase n=1 Tax=Flammeovirga aprica JL-4 TaxID=694437 RepID=A0A7X9NZW6_9BACT|nr:histidine kinase [Flammeovirga aprica]NME66999.1 histidine kinase [Flammeovirga aprica JL-4]